MRGLLSLVVVVCLAWAVPAAAQPIDGRRFNDLMSTYYQHPDPAVALGWLRRLESQALQRPDAIDIVATFYLHILRAHPAQASGLVAAVENASGPVALTAATAVWLAGVPGRDALLGQLRAAGRLSESEVARLTGFATFDATAFQPESAHDLDLCWASFYATGEPMWLEKVARHLPYMLPRDAMEELARRNDPAARQIFERALVARAAAWSLVSHARRHERVKAAMLSLAEGPDKMHKAMRALVDDVLQAGR